jgi:hypothetical protein
MLGYIYKITNPSGNIYIGKTKDFKNRFRSYKNMSCKSQPALYNSLIKYGYGNHNIEIIEECDYNILSEREIYYINFYNSFHSGLNCTFGGDDGFLNGEFNVSKKPEVREKMSKAKHEYYKNNIHPSKGKKASKETIDKIKYKRSIQKPIIRVIIFDIINYNIYYSIKELANELNIPYKTFYYQLTHTEKHKDIYKVINIKKSK